jgi:hypothetical protein
MIVDRSVTLQLSNEEVLMLRSIASITDCEINNAIKTEKPLLGYEWSELKALGEFARRLKDL